MRRHHEDPERARGDPQGENGSCGQDDRDKAEADMARREACARLAPPDAGVQGARQRTGRSNANRVPDGDERHSCWGCGRSAAAHWRRRHWQASPLGRRVPRSLRRRDGRMNTERSDTPGTGRGSGTWRAARRSQTAARGAEKCRSSGLQRPWSVPVAKPWRNTGQLHDTTASAPTGGFWCDGLQPRKRSIPAARRRSTNVSRNNESSPAVTWGFTALGRFRPSVRRRERTAETLPCENRV